MSTTTLKLGTVKESVAEEFSASLRSFLKKTIPGRYRGESSADDSGSELVWYMELIRTLDGCTLFLVAWRDSKQQLVSAVDEFFQAQKSKLQYERIDKGVS